MDALNISRVQNHSGVESIDRSQNRTFARRAAAAILHTIYQTGLRLYRNIPSAQTLTDSVKQILNVISYQGPSATAVDELIYIPFPFG